MHRFAPALLWTLTALLLSGCYISVRDDNLDGTWVREADDWRERQRRNQSYIDHLELGRSLAAVTADLGAPDLNESFVREGQRFRVLLYRTRLVREDGRVTRDETTPLVFVNDELVGWGESAVEHAVP